MKTAEEWVSYLSTNPNAPSKYTIRLIQLDAWRQGMTDAIIAGQQAESESDPFPTRLQRAIARRRDCGL